MNQPLAAPQRDGSSPHQPREVPMVSRRGLISLPSGRRRPLGIEPGSAVIVEELEGELRLRPAAGVALDRYSDADIEAWDRADGLSASDRQALLNRLLAPLTISIRHDQAVP